MTRPVLLGFLAMAVLAVAVGSSVSFVTRGPAFVDRIAIENPTVYNLQVDVGESGDVAADLGTVPREGSRSFERVLDQGERWVFLLFFGGESVGEMVVPRSQLEKDGWRLAVPPEIGHDLSNAGYPPSAF